MSDKSLAKNDPSTLKSSESKSSSPKSPCCAWKLAAALLVLRLCIGWHFFSEGTKKLSYDQGRNEWRVDFPAEHFFRGATGPMAGLFKGLLPGFYDWENLLAVPRQSTPLTDQQRKQRQDWKADYTARQKLAESEKTPLPIEFPEFAPYSVWADQIVAGLRDKLRAFTNISGITDEQDAQAAKLFVARHQQLAVFLDAETNAIEEYQHQLWRLQEMRSLGGAGEIPFRQARVAAKQTETTGLGSRLVSEVRGIERGFSAALRALLTPEQLGNSSLVAPVDSSLADSKERRLEWLKLGIACGVTGLGVCLLLGLFTRLAAAGGVLFLLSVMVTQLPWVPGGDAKFFYYQLVECAALLTLWASSPWRLPGLDYLCCGLRGMCCPAKSV